MNSEIDSLKSLVGNLLSRQLESQGALSSLRDAEFKVFSQFGDDGIIQYLTKKAVRQGEFRFVEFGTQDYTESNTRFLLVNNNWSGLVFDPSVENISFIQRDQIYWRHDLLAVRSFVTPGNFNELLKRHAFDSDIGLMSIDIDGMDYWVWSALEVVQPVIVVVEYNSVFGASAKVTVPFAENFDRTTAHFSNLYWGASLGALNEVAVAKGYKFVGCNSAGNNCYFVREDRMQGLEPVSLEQGYVLSKFRESRDQAGNLTFVRGLDRLRLIAETSVWDVSSGSIKRLIETVGPNER